MGAVLQMQVRLESATCITCGIEFALPEERMSWLRDKKNVLFYCPNGHGQSFTGKTAEQLLREQLAAKEQTLAAERRLKDEAQARALRAEKKLSRTKVGVCPCCKRSFTALRRHMATKHPNWLSKGDFEKGKRST